jgi:uncharacterized protein (DUF4415 family)
MRSKKVDPELVDADNPEWTAEDFARARPAGEVLPPSLLGKLGVRGPQKQPTKEQINIRLSRSVLEAFRETGSGWQTRIDEVLLEWVKSHKPA